MTECTKTKDEQAEVGQDPFRPFPKLEYIQRILDVFEHERRLCLEKSRSMMCSWVVSAWAAHKGFNRPATGVVFQSEDEKRAVNDVNYVKILWENSSDSLKARWPLKKPLDKQAYNTLELENGSWFMGIPGNPDKVRSSHPTIFILDEAAIIERGEASWNTAAGTKTPYMIALSSAYPGWFREMTEFAHPVDWPDYK